MIRKLFCALALVAGLGVATSAPAPAIDFICSCQLCTTANSGLGCRNPDHPGVFISCGEYHVQHCS